MDNIVHSFTEDRMTRFITDLLNLDGAWEMNTKSSSLKIVTKDSGDEKYSYRRVQKRIFERLSVPERKANFDLSQRLKMPLQHEGLDEIEHMPLSGRDLFSDINTKKINEIIEKVNILMRLTNQELNK